MAGQGGGLLQMLRGACELTLLALSIHRCRHPASAVGGFRMDAARQKFASRQPAAGLRQSVVVCLSGGVRMHISMLSQTSSKDSWEVELFEAADGRRPGPVGQGGGVCWWVLLPKNSFVIHYIVLSALCINSYTL